MFLNGDQEAERAFQLMETARDLARSQGADFTALQLARESGVSLHTVYRQFGGKDGVLIELIAQVIEDVCESFEQRVRSVTDPIARLELTIALSLESASSPSARGFINLFATEYARLQAAQPSQIAHALAPLVELFKSDLREARLARAVETESVDFIAVVTVQALAQCCLDTSRLDSEKVGELARGLSTFCRDMWLARYETQPTLGRQACG